MTSISFIDTLIWWFAYTEQQVQLSVVRFSFLYCMVVQCQHLNIFSVINSQMDKLYSSFPKVGHYGNDALQIVLKQNKFSKKVTSNRDWTLVAVTVL